MLARPPSPRHLLAVWYPGPWVRTTVWGASSSLPVCCEDRDNRNLLMHPRVPSAYMHRTCVPRQSAATSGASKGAVCLRRDRCLRPQTSCSMGGQQSRGQGGDAGESEQDKKDKKAKKYEQPAPTRVGKKKKKKQGPPQSARLPIIVPATKCKLRLLKLERCKDYLLMEEEFVLRQEQVKPQEESAQKERSKVDDIRGSPMGVSSLEEVRAAAPLCFLRTSLHCPPRGPHSLHPTAPVCANR